MNSISIVIATLNRTSFLLQTLQDLIVQEYEPGFEIIIVDQSEKEDTAIISFVKLYQFIKYHFITHFKGLPEARNFGVKTAANDYILFVDDDIRCEKDLLTEHAKFLVDEKISVVAGGITEKYDDNKIEPVGSFNNIIAEPSRGFHINLKKIVDHAGGGNFSVKRNSFHEIGGIDEHLTEGAALYEETDFCLRMKKAGYIVFYNYEAHVTHLAAATGGCRVAEIDQYIYSLARNRSIIIERHLPWYFKLTAYLYLSKLVLAYLIKHKSLNIWKQYLKGKREGKLIGTLEVKNEQLN
ncbi:MAG: glycosyltransferase [Flavobacteriaceae bacterium]|nr:glycosyltransferase [Flavobacteriaceae bacterium]